MSYKNPLGPIKKRANSDPEHRNAERREAAHHAKVPYQKPRSYKWFYNLLLLCAMAGLSYWLYLEVVPKEERSIVVFEPSKTTLNIDFTSIAEHLDTDPEVITVESVPNAEAVLFHHQAELFQQVLAAIESQSAAKPVQDGNWDQIIAAFPDKVYFTRPQAGRYKIGTSDLKAEYGSSNVQEMSHNLWASFRDQIEAASPQTIKQDITRMNEDLVQERLARDPNSISYQRQDDYNKARDHADVTWMNSFEQYLQTLASSAGNGSNQSTASQLDPQETLKLWRAFIKQESPQLNQWTSANTINRVPVSSKDAIEVKDAQKTLIHLPLKGNELYFFPGDLTSFVTFTK